MAEFTRAYPPAQPATDGPVWWLPLRGEGDFIFLLEETAGAGTDPAIGPGAAAPAGRMLYGNWADLAPRLAPDPAQPPLYLGTLDGAPVVASRYDSVEPLPNGWASAGLRALYSQTDETTYALAGYAYQLLEWQRTSRFCPVCATATVELSGDWGKRCPNCGLVRYPPVTPAVLALVHDGQGQILLTHKAGWGKMYSIIAGFVEPGESLEGCVEREVLEEAGLRITAPPVYYGSQPWPFPHQLMIGYLVEANSADPVQPDMAELDEAHWFKAGELPALPPRLSLSHQLIEHWRTLAAGLEQLEA